MTKKLKSKKRYATSKNNFDKTFDSHLKKNNVSVIKDNNNLIIIIIYILFLGRAINVQIYLNLLKVRKNSQYVEKLLL